MTSSTTAKTTTIATRIEVDAVTAQYNPPVRGLRVTSRVKAGLNFATIEY